MDCKHIQNSIAGYCEGTLPEAQRAAFERHCNECPECRRLVEEFAPMWGAATAPGTERLSPYFRTRLMAHLEEKSREKRTAGIFSGLLKPAAVAALALIGVFCGYSIGKQYAAAPQEMKTAAEPAYLSAFEDIPGGSLADAYLNHFRR